MVSQSGQHNFQIRQMFHMRVNIHGWVAKVEHQKDVYDILEDGIHRRLEGS